MPETALELFADFLCDAPCEDDPFINRGHGMAALTLFEASSLSSEARYIRFANHHLERAVELIDRLPLSNSLYRGVTGLGWVVKKYYRQVNHDWKSGFLIDLDSHLADGVSDSENLNIDVVDGLAGIMIYANARGQAPLTKSHKLLNDAIRLAIPKYLERFLLVKDAKPKAYTNLGMAHGIPGLLTQCARFIENDDSSDHLIPLLRLAFDRLWSHANEVDDIAWFPHFVSQTAPARLAWCYGSLGLYVAFDRASRIFASPNSRCESLLHGIQKQYSMQDGIRDASVCHGHSGLLAFSVAVGTEANKQLAPIVEAATEKTRQALIENDENMAVMYASAGGIARCRNLLEGTAGCVLALNSLHTTSQSNWMDLLGYN